MEERRFTEEELERAKEVSMTQLAQYLGYTPVRVGKCHTLKEMDSIRIYNDRSWYRWSDRTGGTAIDFLLKFGEYDSVRQAVSVLLDMQGVLVQRDEVRRVERQERREFQLPPKAENYKRVFAYLMKTRSLSYEIVAYFVKKKLLYEEQEHHNCVFVGYDREGIARHATCRGTGTGVRFVGDVEGNDKKYVLHIIQPMSDEVKVFESAIDCMSYMDLSGDYTSNKQVLGMTADNPLEQTLKDNPHIRKISFCLDWDSAGRKAVYGDDNHIGLLKKYKEMGYLVRDISSVHEKYQIQTEDMGQKFQGKDWNELLGYNRKIREEKKVIEAGAMLQERSR